MWLPVISCQRPLCQYWGALRLWKVPWLWRSLTTKARCTLRVPSKLSKSQIGCLPTLDWVSFSPSQTVQRIKVTEVEFPLSQHRDLLVRQRERFLCPRLPALCCCIAYLRVHHFWQCQTRFVSSSLIIYSFNYIWAQFPVGGRVGQQQQRTWIAPIKKRLSRNLSQRQKVEMLLVP